MLDKKILFKPETIDNLKKRGYEHPDDLEANLDYEKSILQQIEKMNTDSNNRIAVDKEKLRQLKEEMTDIADYNHHQMARIPNLLHETVPFGLSDKDNPVVKVVGEIEPVSRGHHVDIFNAKEILLDQKTGVEMSGSRFAVFKESLAEVQTYCIAEAVEFYIGLGYVHHYVPLLVNRETMYGTGQYPKFADDLFETMEGMYLIPTGEVPLTNMFKNKTFKEDEVNQMLMTATPCFRKEAGSAGKDTKGVLRLHQFEKVELVRACLPENGLATLDEMLADIESFLAEYVKVPYRVVELCSNDIGFSGHKAYDIELWFEGEKKYREIASITWCGDFQARRLNAKFVRNGKKEYIHTLNGTGLAVGRVMAAMAEYHGCMWI